MSQTFSNEDFESEIEEVADHEEESQKTNTDLPSALYLAQDSSKNDPETATKKATIQTDSGCKESEVDEDIPINDSMDKRPSTKHSRARTNQSEDIIEEN